MSHNNTGTAGPFSLDFSYGDGNEYLKAKEAAIWENWFESGLWDYRNAIRLAVCGPCNAIRICTKYCEKGIREFDSSYPHDKYECFHSKLRDIDDQMSAFLNLYESEVWSQYGFSNDDIPASISPAKFISWALTKKTITLPDEMKDWLASHSPHKKTPLSQGGSNAESDKIVATKKMCELVIKSICDGDETYFGSDGVLGEKEFIAQVRDAMVANGCADNFQSTAAKKEFRSSKQLKRFKRQRGRKPNNNSKS